MSNQRLVQDLKNQLEVNLPFKIPDFQQRIAIWSELDKYRAKEDESTWKQLRGKAYEAYEVYFDGEFVCFFDLGMTAQQVINTVMESMRDLFKSEKIFVNKEMYKVKEAQEEEKRKKEEIVLEKPTTEVDKILTEVVKRQAKRKKRKVVIKDTRKSL